MSYKEGLKTFKLQFHSLVIGSGASLTTMKILVIHALCQCPSSNSSKT